MNLSLNLINAETVVVLLSLQVKVERKYSALTLVGILGTTSTETEKTTRLIAFAFVKIAPHFFKFTVPQIDNFALMIVTSLIDSKKPRKA